MAKKKAASTPVKKAAVKKVAVKKTAVKKVAVKKSVGKKGAVKKNATAKQNREMQGGPLPVNYALRLAGQFGGFYYYLMLQCPDMIVVLGVVKSSYGNLAKTCEAIAPANQQLVHTEWYKGYRPTGELGAE
jgi:hypothetical protein